MEAKLFPATYSMAVTPSDAALILDGSEPVKCRGISFSGAGSITYLDPKGAQRVLNGLAAGIIHPISTNKIFATGTTATGIYVYW